MLPSWGPRWTCTIVITAQTEQVCVLLPNWYWCCTYSDGITPIVIGFVNRLAFVLDWTKKRDVGRSYFSSKGNWDNNSWLAIRINIGENCVKPLWGGKNYVLPMCFAPSLQYMFDSIIRRRLLCKSYFVWYCLNGNCHGLWSGIFLPALATITGDIVSDKNGNNGTIFPTMVWAEPESEEGAGLQRTTWGRFHEKLKPQQCV